MKYQELYEYAIKNECTVVEFDTNIIPNKGWAIVRAGSGLHLNIKPDTFDRTVDWATTVKGSTHLIIINEDGGLNIAHGVVYNNQQFAMGYAAALDRGFVIDCFTGKKVMRR